MVFKPSKVVFKPSSSSGPVVLPDPAPIIFEACSFNVNGVRNHVEALQTLSLEGIAFIGIQETHVKRKFLPRLAGYSSFSDTDPGCHRGVALYSKDSAVQLQFYSSWGGSAVWASCRGWPFASHEIGLIGVVHLHPHCPSDEKRLSAFLRQHTPKYSILLMGDLNLQPPPKADLSQVWYGNSMSKLGRIVVAGNLHLGKYIGSSQSHAHRRGGTTIDYVMGPESWSNVLLFSRIRSDVPGSDHLAVITRWEIPTSGLLEKQSRPGRLTSKAIQHCVQLMGDDMNIDTIPDASSLTTLVQQRLTPFRRQQSPPIHRFWKETGWMRQLRRRMELAWKSHLASNTRGSWIAWRTLQLMWRAHSRDLRYQSYQQYLSNLALSVRGDRCWYFREAKKLMGREPRNKLTPKLLDETKNEVESYMVPGLLRKHFTKLFAPRDNHDLIFALHHQTIQARHIRVEEGWFSVFDAVSILELRINLSHVSTTTAVGPDEIPVEFWKVWCASDGGATLLAKLFSDILSTRNFPEIWKDSWLVLIPKTSQPTSASD